MLQVITELEIRLLHSRCSTMYFVSLEALSVIRPLGLRRLRWCILALVGGLVVSTKA